MRLAILGGCGVTGRSVVLVHALDQGPGLVHFFIKTAFENSNQEFIAVSRYHQDGLDKHLQPVSKLEQHRCPTTLNKKPTRYSSMGKPPAMHWPSCPGVLSQFSDKGSKFQ